MTSEEITNNSVDPAEAVKREAWVKPTIESFLDVSATASVTSTNPGDIINSNS